MAQRGAPIIPSVEHRVIHGHRRAFVKVGSGPALLLLHGLGSNLTTWDRVLPLLARNFTVIAPDLLGHGQSAKPRADYSLGGYANGMRDLLSVLGVERATVVGHSFGGGVAMQFAYQFPQSCERVVLVATGGLGPEVTPLLRALSLPGASTALSVATLPPVRQFLGLVAKVTMALPDVGVERLFPVIRDFPEILSAYEALAEPATRSAFLHVLRAAIDHQGQVITMVDRGYLVAPMPVQIIWGTRDPVIPVAHAHRGAASLPGSRLVLMEGLGHFPHREQPVAFARALEEFVASSAPAIYDAARFRGMLRGGAPAVAAPIKGGSRRPPGAAPPRKPPRRGASPGRVATPLPPPG